MLKPLLLNLVSTSQTLPLFPHHVPTMSNNLPSLNTLPVEVQQQCIFRHLTPEDLAKLSMTCKNQYDNISVYATHQIHVLKQAVKAKSVTTKEFDITPYTRGTSLETYDNILPHVCVKLMRNWFTTDLNRFKQEYNHATRLFGLITKDYKKYEIFRCHVSVIKFKYKYFEGSLRNSSDDTLNFLLSQLLITLISPILEYNIETKQKLLSYMLKDICRFYMFSEMNEYNYRAFIKLLDWCDDEQLVTLMKQMILQVEQNGYIKEKCDKLSTVFTTLQRRTMVIYILWSKYTSGQPLWILIKVTHILLEKPIKNNDKKAIGNVLHDMCLNMVNSEYLCRTLNPIYDKMTTDVQEFLKKYWGY